MSITSLNDVRVLALDPTSGGIGFAVLEGPHQLIDWGVKSAPERTPHYALWLIEALIARYEPDVIVLEDCEACGSRRCPRVRALIRQIVRRAAKHDIKTHRFAGRQIREAFAATNGLTKYRRARAIAEQFPELAPRVPPVRRPWMSEDYRMSIFDAVGLAVTFFYFEHRCNHAG